MIVVQRQLEGFPKCFQVIVRLEPFGWVSRGLRESHKLRQGRRSGTYGATMTQKFALVESAKELTM